MDRRPPRHPVPAPRLSQTPAPPSPHRTFSSSIAGSRSTHRPAEAAATAHPAPARAGPPHAGDYIGQSSPLQLQSQDSSTDRRPSRCRRRSSRGSRTDRSMHFHCGTPHPRNSRSPGDTSSRPRTRSTSRRRSSHSEVRLVGRDHLLRVGAIGSTLMLDEAEQGLHKCADQIWNRSLIARLDGGKDPSPDRSAFASWSTSKAVLLAAWLAETAFSSRRTPAPPFGVRRLRVTPSLTCTVPALSQIYQVWAAARAVVLYWTEKLP